MSLRSDQHHLSMPISFHVSSYHTCTLKNIFLYTCYRVITLSVTRGKRQYQSYAAMSPVVLRLRYQRSCFSLDEEGEDRSLTIGMRVPTLTGGQRRSYFTIEQSELTEFCLSTSLGRLNSRLLAFSSCKRKASSRFWLSCVMGSSSIRAGGFTFWPRGLVKEATGPVDVALCLLACSASLSHLAFRSAAT